MVILVAAKPPLPRVIPLIKITHMTNQEREPQMVDLFSENIESSFNSTGKIYKRKIQPILGAKKVTKTTEVKTCLPDGTLESIQDANPGDWIITGSEGEKFVFTDKKFQSLYKSDGKDGWIPRERKIVAILNPIGMPIRISAPWGTPEKPAFQDGSEKAMLVAEITPDGTLAKDRYIIGDLKMLLNNYEPE